MRKMSKQTICNGIRKWIQGLPISEVAKKYYHFEYVGEERNNYRFRFCIDGDLVEILYYSDYEDSIYKKEREKFNKIFKGTNWNYNFEDPTILIIFMED